MNINNKLEAMEKEVIYQAEEECSKLRTEYENKRDALVSKQELILLTDMYNAIQKEKKKASKEKNNNILSVTIENKQKLTHLRESLIDELFYEIEKKLVLFVNSEEYLSYLKKVLDSALYSFPNENVTVLLSKNDIKYREEIKKYSSCIEAIEITFDDFIGGLIVLGNESKKRFDNTLKTILGIERKNFLKNGKLTCDII